MATPATYSFLDVVGSIVGPNGAFPIGQGAGTDEGGVTAEFSEEKGTVKAGADGTPMHTLNATKIGKITIRLLKTSPTNALLSALYDADTADASDYGQNTIVFTNTSMLDVVSGQQCGQAKYPTVVYAKEGPMLEWVFNVGVLNIMLGVGAG